MTIKLSKKGGPVLNFEILTPLGPILQDVPVNVLSAIRLQECAEPFTEAINGFMLPKFPVLHSVLERFKGLGNDLIIEADVKEESADMALAVRTDMISVCTAFNNLRRATFGGYGNTEQLAEPAEYKALIDRRNFARCVYAEALTPQYTICFVFNNSVLLHVLGGWGVTMSYYIPKKHAL